MLRGFDMRKPKDGICHILAYNTKLTWTEVQQSAGRACRNQGKATCVVWTSDLPASANPRTAFSLNEKDPTEMMEFLHQATSALDYIHKAKRAEVVAVFEGNKWIMPKSAFMTTHPAIYKLVQAAFKEKVEKYEKQIFGNEVKKVIS